MAVKDNIVTTESTTTCASRFLQDYRSPFQASVVRQLLKSRHDIRGKTNMDEFGMGSHSTHSYFGPVSNRFPWSHRSAGGSSGGSAVAVASSIPVYLSLGTDTGGSVRLPAAYTGVVGFKPSYGRISRWGIIPYANSLDTVGILGPTVEDHRKANAPRDILVDLGHHILHLHDPKDSTSLTYNCRKRINSRTDKWKEEHRPPMALGEMKNPLRIGVPIEYNIEELQPVIRNAWIHVLEELQNMGQRIVPVSLPTTKHALSAYYVIAAAEAASNLAKYDGVRYGSCSESSEGTGSVLYDSIRGNGFGDEVKRRILLGSYTLSSEAIDNYFIQAQKVRRLVQRDFDRVFAMPNPLRPAEQFDLSNMDEGIQLEDKLGPTQVDVLLCPTAPTLPPLLEEVKEQSAVDSYMNDIFTVPASLAGLPAISVPVRLHQHQLVEDNVPFAGIQVIGQYSDDNLVIQVGKLVQELPTMESISDIANKNDAPKIRRLTFEDGKWSPQALGQD